MRLLLDTHLLLWALAAPSRLSADVRKQIDAAEVYASAVSIWEISIKSALGQLDADRTGTS
jgi:PIN domain nuclease of toxin-antitoxin system